MAWRLGTLLLLGCTATAEPEASVVSEGGCPEALRSEYRATRDALNTCTSEDDCTMIWPGACPDGPYFISARTDIRPILALEERIEACTLTECEPPPVLAPAGCVKGRCVAGARSPLPPDGPLETCWDTPIRYLENEATVTLPLTATIIGTTPLSVYEVPQAGMLNFTVHWPPDCPDCTLRISEHNSGMSQLVKGLPPLRTGTTETVSVPVTPGPYYIVPVSEKTTSNVRIHVFHQTPSTARPPSGAHGQGLRRLCEG